MQLLSAQAEVILGMVVHRAILQSLLKMVKMVFWAMEVTAFIRQVVEIGSMEQVAEEA